MSTEILNQLIRTFDYIPTVSDRGFKIGGPCQVFGVDDDAYVWWDAKITKIYNKPGTDETWIQFKYEHNGSSVYLETHEWDRDVVNVHANTNTEYNNYQQNIHGCNGVVMDCMPTRRIIEALQFYQRLNLASNEDKNDFTKFFNDGYTQLLNDWTHFVSKHNDSYELEQVFDDIIQNECELRNCPFIINHLRDRTGDELDEKYQSDHEPFLFLKDLLDGIHCHLYHLWDCGYRTRLNDEQSSFESIFKKTKDRQNIMRTIDGLNIGRYSHGKFNIYSEAEHNEDYTKDQTFIDGIYGHLMKTENQQIVSTLHNIIINEAFDTDALVSDISYFQDHKKSIIHQLMDCDYKFNVIYEYIHDQKCMLCLVSNSFSRSVFANVMLHIQCDDAPSVLDIHFFTGAIIKININMTWTMRHMIQI